MEGNIGAGKTTLAKFLSKHLNGSLLLEQFEENHFLKAFYDGKDFALHAELQFILDRSKQLSDFFSKDHTLIISDYIPQKSLIFSKMNLSKDEYRVIANLTKILYKQFSDPDLIIFIDRDNEGLIDNIMKRGRPYESKIDHSYINNLTQGYEDWLEEVKQPVLRINASEINMSQPERLSNAFIKILNQKYTNNQRKITLKELI